MNLLKIYTLSLCLSFSLLSVATTSLKCESIFLSKEILSVDDSLSGIREQVKKAIYKLPKKQLNELLDIEANEIENNLNLDKMIYTYTNDISFTPDFFESSKINPIAFLSINNRGWSLYNHNFYFSHYHASQRVFPGKPETPPSMEDLVFNQPWFKWDIKSKTYEIKQGGASKQIMDSLFENANSDFITLYRGTRTEELSFMQKITTKQKQALIELNKRLNFDNGDYNAYFFTPSLTEARNFSRGLVAEITLSRTLVNQLLADNKIYAGVESTRIEVAFFDFETLLMIAPLYKMNELTAN